jgi:enoyl-CoA hydratase/carnithine racemase
VAGIVFMVSGVVASMVVKPHALHHSVLKIETGTETAAAPAKEEPLAPIAPLLASADLAAGEALAKAIELAERVATNAPMTNYALIQGLPRIAEQPADHGFLTESMLAAIAQSAPEAKARVKAFLDGTGPKVRA